MLRVMRHNSAGFYSIGPCRSSSDLLTLLFLERAPSAALGPKVCFCLFLVLLRANIHNHRSWNPFDYYYKIHLKNETRAVQNRP